MKLPGDAYSGLIKIAKVVMYIINIAAILALLGLILWQVIISNKV